MAALFGYDHQPLLHTCPVTGGSRGDGASRSWHDPSRPHTLNMCTACSGDEHVDDEPEAEPTSVCARCGYDWEFEGFCDACADELAGVA